MERAWAKSWAMTIPQPFSPTGPSNADFKDSE